MPASVWKGQLTFGLVSFPVRLSVAARSETVSFNQLHKTDGSRIKLVTFCQAEDKPIPRSEIVKGYEHEKGQYVVIEDEDIKKVAPPTARVMEILEFVKSTDVDPVYLESSYYLAPEDGGQKPYALLFAAMKESGFYGIAKIAMHNREHIVVLRPAHKGMTLHTMYYADEIRAVDEFVSDVSDLKEKELALARMLIDSLAGEFEPAKYHDTYRENLERMIEAKIAGKAITETAVPAASKVIDIMDALRKSLEQRKPAQRATEASGSSQESEKPAAKKRAGQKRPSIASA